MEITKVPMTVVNNDGSVTVAGQTLRVSGSDIIITGDHPESKFILATMDSEEAAKFVIRLFSAEKKRDQVPVKLSDANLDCAFEFWVDHNFRAVAFHMNGTIDLGTVVEDGASILNGLWRLQENEDLASRARLRRETGVGPSIDVYTASVD